jgi:long-chain acyl-CoA synthetase
MPHSPPETLASSFAQRLARSPDVLALYIAPQDGYEGRTWSEVAQDVFRLAAALHTLGVRRSDRVVQWSENRYEWILTDLALHVLGAIHVPLHASLSAPQAVEQVEQSDTRFVLVSTAELFHKLMQHWDRVPDDLVCLAHEPVRGRVAPHVRSLHDLSAGADAGLGKSLMEQTIASGAGDEVATILYTSGTTGRAKGIMLTHANLVANTRAILEAFGDRPDDLRVCFLPLSHIFARTCDLYTWIARGSQLALARCRETIIEDCKSVGPSLINGVPYFFERVHRGLVERGVANEPGSLSRALGGKIRACCSGGAALADETFDFFQQHHIPLLQGYGLTETSPVITLSTPEQCKRGTVGRPIPGVEVRIAADGEILTRGPHVMKGYWRDEKATAEVLRDGWLHTGDLGTLDDEGFLTITGRKKEMIVTATGKNVFPAHLESLLCRDPFILQACVIGDRRHYLTALIVPDPDKLRAEIKRRRLFVFSKKSAVRHPQVVELYRQRIASQLSGLSPHEQVRQFTLLPRGFTVEEGHLTPKLSLRRDVVQRQFATEIDAMYKTHPKHERGERKPDAQASET